MTARLAILFIALLLLGCQHHNHKDAGRRPQVLPDRHYGVVAYDLDSKIDDLDLQDDLEDHIESPNSKEAEVPKEYRFAIGDILAITLLDEGEEFSENSIVAPDGNIYYAFLDGIPVMGRSLQEVTVEIQNQLGKFFLHPIVTVAPTISNAQVFKILGRVRRPGVYPLNIKMTVREAIALAGDLQTESYKDKDSDSDLIPLVDFNQSYLLRNGEKVKIDFDKLIHTPSYKDDILVQADDFIYLAPSEATNIYIVGAVAAPRRLTWRRDFTLMEALSTAGGWNYGSPLGANLQSILLVRGPLESPCAMCIDLTRILNGTARDFLLQPGDIIYVHNKTMRFGRYLVRVAIDSFLQSFGVGAGSYYANSRWFHLSDLSTVVDDGL